MRVNERRNGSGKVDREGGEQDKRARSEGIRVGGNLRWVRLSKDERLLLKAIVVLDTEVLPCKGIMETVEPEEEDDQLAICLEQS